MQVTLQKSLDFVNCHAILRMGVLEKLNSLIGSLFITVALFCLTGELHSGPTSADLSYFKIIKNGLVREGPASYYKIAENLEIGTIVQAFEKHDDWYLIKTHSGRIGWIVASDVTPQVQSQDLMAKTNLQNGSPPNIDQKMPLLFTENLKLLTTGFLWTEPDGSGKIIGYLILGLRVKKLETNGIFYKIQLQNGLIGWADQSLFTIAEPKLPLPLPKTVAKNGNLRQEPSLSAPVIEKIPKGKSVTIIDSTDGWYKIKTASDLTGWLHQSLFNGETGLQNGGKLSVKILLRNGNLRQSPNLAGKVIQVIPAQTAITVLDSLSGWYQVHLPDETIGWINQSLFEK